jgi:zinc protease
MTRRMKDDWFAPLAVMCIAGCLTTSGDKAAGRLPSPPPTDPPPQVDGDTTTATVNGLPVIIKRLPTAELVAASLYIRGGARNWGKDNAGVERFACSVAVGGGPQGMTKDAFKRRQVALGSHIRIATSADYTEFRAKGLAKTWDETFDLLMQVFLKPALTDAEIAMKRSQLINQLEQERDQPDEYLKLVTKRLVFKGHVFENSADGTRETLSRLQRKDLEAHLASLRETSRLVLVVVGDVDPGKVIAQTRRQLGALPRGRHVDRPLPPLTFSHPNLVTDARKMPTNYVTAVFAAPAWGEGLFPASGIAIDLLSARIFAEVRAKRGLSYAPYAVIAADSYLPFGILHVTSTEPSAAMKVMLDEVRRLRSETVSARELEETKAVFLTRYLSLLDSTDGIVGVLGSAQMYTGDWRYARTLPGLMGAVTPADVQAFARRYIANLQTVVLGDPAKVDRDVFLGL